MRLPGPGGPVPGGPVPGGPGPAAGSGCRHAMALASPGAAAVVRRWPGHALGRDQLLDDGLRMLTWLLAAQTRDGHRPVVPAAGWARGEDRPAFDQHPSQVAALAAARARAAQVTGDTAGPAWK
jgi:hypothetical protein